MPEADLWTGPTESLEAEGEKSSPMANINSNKSRSQFRYCSIELQRLSVFGPLLLVLYTSDVDH